MPVFKNESNGTWYVMARYVNWKGERKQKCKRGFSTKKEAQEWERMFQLQNSSDMDMSFEAFTELYIRDMKSRLKENTWLTKEHIIRTKILPYFGKLKISEISTKEVIAWQNEMLAYRDEKKKPYSQTYLKTLHNQLSATVICGHSSFYWIVSRWADENGFERKRNFMIQISNLSKKYGETVVFSDLNYTFENACIYGLVGRNGTGKTTLLNILSNYDKNYTGVISIDRKKMNKVDYLDMPVAYAMDQPSFFNELTIYENLLLIASSRKIKKQEAFDKIERILDGLGLKKYENYSPLELSKGTMQRLNNACAMIQEEKITIFDEPFSGLDPVQMKLLENVIVEFHKKEKGIYIISSHDIECLQNVCDKCLLLHNGQIREINMEEVDREEIAKILSEGE